MVKYYKTINVATKNTLNDSSKFSPPQMSKPLSYVPSCSKKLLSILNNPPAMVGLQTGSAEFWCRLRSRSGTACQLNWRFQSKPPTDTPSESLQWNSSVVSSITSMTGHTTVVLLRAMRSSRGSSHPGHSKVQVSKFRFMK